MFTQLCPVTSPFQQKASSSSSANKSFLPFLKVLFLFILHTASVSDQILHSKFHSLGQSHSLDPVYMLDAV